MFPSCFSHVLHDLVSLLYNGYIANIARNQAEMLMLLAKDLGLTFSLDNSDIKKVGNSSLKKNVRDEKYKDAQINKANVITTALS